MVVGIGFGSLRLSQKLKGFIWLVKHGKLLTNKMRVRRKFIVDAFCQICNYAKEDITHLFWDCPKAKRVWSFFLPDSEIMQDLNMNMLNWIEYNLRRRDRVSRWNTPWNILFTIIIWHIWRDINKECFEGNMKPAAAAAKLALAYAQEINATFINGKHIVMHKETKQTHWNFLAAGFIKLNTGGANKVIQEKQAFEEYSEMSNGNGLVAVMEKLAPLQV